MKCLTGVLHRLQCGLKNVELVHDRSIAEVRSNLRQVVALESWTSGLRFANETLWQKCKAYPSTRTEVESQFCTSAKVWLRNSSMTRCFSATSSRMMATFQRRLGNHTASCWPGQQDDVTMLAPGFASLHCCLPASGANSGFLPRARHPSTFRKFRKPVRDRRKSVCYTDNLEGAPASLAC